MPTISSIGTPSTPGTTYGPRPTSPAAVELIALANSVFGNDSRTSDTPHGASAGKEHQR